MSCVAFFVTPHGFGHASRACAVIQELRRIAPSITPLILTTVPKKFFENSLEDGFFYYPVETDVGFAQLSALEIDMEKTVADLKRFYKSYHERAKDVKDLLKRNDTRLVVCDISPFGIQIASELNLRSVLIENFTWDWMYGFYEQRFPELVPISRHIKEVNQTSSYRVRTIPYCGQAPYDLLVPPISRGIRNSRDKVREKLAIKPNEKMVLVSMGGVFEELRFINARFLEGLKHHSVKIVCTTEDRGFKRSDNLIFFPKLSDFYHPDLLNASDGVIGKLGYSTLAEVAHTGVPSAFVVRKDHPETDYLRSFLHTLGNGLEVTLMEFRGKGMLEKVEKLLELERTEARWANGASECANLIVHLLN